MGNERSASRFQSAYQIRTFVVFRPKILSVFMLFTLNAMRRLCHGVLGLATRAISGQNLVCAVPQDRAGIRGYALCEHYHDHTALPPSSASSSFRLLSRSHLHTRSRWWCRLTSLGRRYGGFFRTACSSRAAERCCVVARTKRCRKSQGPSRPFVVPFSRACLVLPAMTSVLPLRRREPVQL